MRSVICLFIVICFCEPASPQKQQMYAYTNLSKRFFTDAEIDSLFYHAASEVFEYNKVPVSFLEKNYASIKPLLIDCSQKQIQKQFKLVEFYNETGVRAEKDSESFIKVKKQYAKVFDKIIEQCFLQNHSLKKYIQFNTSDRIAWFHALVNIQSNGKLIVTETIVIYNGDKEPAPNEPEEYKQSGLRNNEIQKGIIRTFPTLYTGKGALFYTTGFSLKNVQRAGEKNEPWHLKREKNGYAVYIGNPGYYLPQGLFTYTITYETDNQIKHLQQFDELVWNVTGNGWSFRIDSAACTIILPNKTTSLSAACYTGLIGSANKDCSITHAKSNNTVYFKTTRPLIPKEGITIAISWKKGIVTPPSSLQKIGQLFINNQAVFLLPLLGFLFGMYNFFMWLKVGRDPKPDTIIPEFFPPNKMSPAAVGYVYHQGFENRLLAATITDWAARKIINIQVQKEGLLFKTPLYIIEKGLEHTKPADYNDFSEDAYRIIGTTISKNKYNSGLASIQKYIKQAMEEKYKATSKNAFKGLFILNDTYMAPGNLLTVLGFFYILFGVLTKPGMQNGWHFLYLFGGLLLCMSIQTFYYTVIKAYTVEGRKVMDKIEGFKMFLTAADEQRLNDMNPPQKTIELYEKYLPFAIALNCEIEWGKQFEEILDTASIQQQQHIQTSSINRSLASSFTNDFSNIISAASSPPSSTSGGGSSFGGGSSGSGGGGGGGGGW